MGKFFICCRIQLKYRLIFRLKPSNDRGEFELDRAKRKNNIAENSFALGHETANTCYCISLLKHFSVFPSTLTMVVFYTKKSFTVIDYYTIYCRRRLIPVFLWL